MSKIGRNKGRIMDERVCFYIGSMALGGVGKMSLHLMNEFIKRGVLVDLFLMKNDGEYLSQLPKEVRVFVGSGSYIKRIIKFINYLYKERPAFSISARQRQDLVNIFCCIMTFCRTKPVITIHTNLSAENRLNSKPRNAGLHISVLAKLFYRFPRKFIAVSNGVADDFAERTGIKRSRIKTIYNPVVNEGSTYSGEIPGAFESLMQTGKKFIVAVGRFTEQKDFSTLLKAFALVRQEKDISLVMLGDGPLRSEIEKEITELNIIDNVLLLGYVPNPQYYISKASVFAISSKWEGFGIVIVEALGVGTPVVATDCPSGPREILEDGKYGRLVPVSDFNAMAAAIIEMVEAPHDALFLKKRAAWFSSDRVADEYLNVIFDN